MKNLVILLVLSLGSPALASKEKTPKPAAKNPAKLSRKVAQVQSEAPEAAVFAAFLECRGRLPESTTSFSSCLEPATVQAPSRRRSFERFLISPVEVSRIRDCRSEELAAARGFPEATEHVVCFDYRDGIREAVGLAYFLKHAGKFRLFSLHSVSGL